ncbi:MAG: hypothetical protein EXQ59_01775 [Acidobacteria bacterium]|nr:hypothetical protein [Acidobacteriota bacterium]
MTLEAGDIIATGTPEGVGFGRTPPEFLADGDILETAVEGIGMMRNIMRTAEAGQPPVGSGGHGGLGDSLGRALAARGRGLYGSRRIGRLEHDTGGCERARSMHVELDLGVVLVRAADGTIAVLGLRNAVAD